MVYQPTRWQGPQIGTLGAMISNSQAIDSPPIIISSPHTTEKEIINVVEETFGVGIADMRGRIRKRTLVMSRMCLAYLLKKHLAYSLERCGEVLQRDHTTIIHYLHDIRINWRNQDWWHYIEKAENKL